MKTRTARWLSGRLAEVVSIATIAGCLSVASALPASAQEAQVDEYRAVLQQISNVRSNLAQRDFYVSQQSAAISDLRARIAEAEGTDARAELLPLVREMVAELEKVMTQDLPIRPDRRFALLDKLREDLQQSDVSVADTFRRAMEIYSDEVELGLTVGSYTGNNPVNPGGRFAACQESIENPKCELTDDQQSALRGGADLRDLVEQIQDGNYLHFGRLALFYLERDSSVGYRYDATRPAGENWVQVPNADLLSLRQSVRIARGESAISTMTTPVRVGERGADAS